MTNEKLRATLTFYYDFVDAKAPCASYESDGILKDGDVLDKVKEMVPKHVW